LDSAGGKEFNQKALGLSLDGFESGVFLGDRITDAN
jgi:hypothetical protein